MDQSDPPESVKKLIEHSLRRDDGWTLLPINFANQEFVDFCRYARSVEKLVEQAEQADLHSLEPQAELLPEGDREEFWAWNYPIHWDQVVRVTFRASTVIAFISFIETTVVRTTDDVRIVTQEILKLRDLYGSQIQKCILYLKRFGGFEIPEVVTQRLDDIVQVRNVLVHANGYLDQSAKSNRVRSMIGSVPGLTEEHGRVFIGKDYVEHCLKNGQELLSLLLNQTRQLWERRQKFEDKNS